MKKTNIRRIRKISAFMLVFAMMLSMSSSVFAAKPDSGAETFSNRYDYVTVKGEEHQLLSEDKPLSQLRTEQAIREYATKIAECGGAYFGPNVLVGPLAEELTDKILDANGVGAVHFDVYSRIDVRYQVDSLTGERTEISSTYHFIIEYYDDAGEMSGGREFTKHI